MSSVYHEMTDEKLDEQIEEARAELRELRFTYGVARSLPNPSRINNLRKNIARILTIKKEREIGVAQVKPASGKGSKNKK